MSASDIKNEINCKKNDIKNVIGALETNFMSAIGDLTKVFKEELATVTQLVDNTKTNMMNKIEEVATSNVTIEEKISRAVTSSASDIAAAQVEINNIVSKVQQQNHIIEEQNNKIVGKIEAAGDPAGDWQVAGGKKEKRKISYASMAKLESNTLLIKGKNEQTPQQIKESLKKSMIHVKIDQMRTSRNGVVLNLDEDEVTKARQVVNDDQDLELKEASKMDPKIFVPDVHADEVDQSTEGKVELEHFIREKKWLL